MIGAHRHPKAVILSYARYLALAGGTAAERRLATFVA